MGPVLLTSPRQLPPPLDNEDAGVAHVSAPVAGQLETLSEVRLILRTDSEPGTEKNVSERTDHVDQFSLHQALSTCWI